MIYKITKKQKFNQLLTKLNKNKKYIYDTANDLISDNFTFT